MDSIRDLLKEKLHSLSGLDRWSVAYGDCEEHGPYSTLVLKGHKARCPACFVAEVRREDEERAASNASRGLATFWSDGAPRSVPPERFADASFENYRIEEVDQFVRNGQIRVLTALNDYVDRFGDNPGANLILSGSVGTGKTHLAISLASRLAARGFRSAYLSVFDLMRAGQRRYGADNNDILERLRSYDIVMIDEIGAHMDFGYSAETMAATMFQLIDSRYQRRRSTMVITNIDAGQLGTSRAGIGDRAMDRLSDAVTLKLFGESAR